MTTNASVAGLVLEIKDVSVTAGAVTALYRTTLRVPPGESIAVMGPSGSGKSTLLHCVSGLTKPRTGRIIFKGNDVWGGTRKARARLRREQMGLIFQDADLLPEFSTVENVAFTLLFDGVPARSAMDLANRALEDVGLGDRADADPRVLSGGEAHRVAVARALVRPDVSLVIADEPTAALDADNAARITSLLLDVASTRGAAVLLATHDPAVAKSCDRVFTLSRPEESEPV